MMDLLLPMVSGRAFPGYWFRLGVCVWGGNPFHGHMGPTGDMRFSEPSSVASAMLKPISYSAAPGIHVFLLMNKE